MKSLQSHSTTSSGGHGQLGFHPACPICRAERLFGTPADNGLSSRRVPALAAAAALAIMPFAAAAAPVRADDGDEQHVGTQDPDSLPSQDPADDPSFKPPQGPGGPDQDQGPVVDPDAPTNDGEVDPLDEGNTPPPSSPVTPPPAPVAPTPQAIPPAPAPPTPPAVAPPAPVLPSDTPNPPAKKTPAEKHRTKPTHSPPPPRRPVAPAPVVPSRVGGPAQPEPASKAPRKVHTPHPATTKSPAPARGHSYTVQSGDSLWSIARELVGPEASNARVAVLVDRLWTLNAGRIGTGNPDMLKIGTDLALP